MGCLCDLVQAAIHDRAVLRVWRGIRECANPKTALEFVEMGAPITKEQYCNDCITGYFQEITNVHAPDEYGVPERP